MKLLEVLDILRQWRINVSKSQSSTQCYEGLKKVVGVKPGLAKIYIIIVYQNWKARYFFKHGKSSPSISIEILSHYSYFHLFPTEKN